jgi:hypothetical protein
LAEESILGWRIHTNEFLYRSRNGFLVSDSVFGP